MASANGSPLCPARRETKASPVFAEPWQAQAFALAVKLSADGHFTWKEWAAALAEELTARRRSWRARRWLALLRPLARGSRAARHRARPGEVRSA